VLALTVFAGVATAFAGGLLLRLPWAAWLGAAAFISGLLAVTASARIYMVPARPAWNLPFTLSDFFLTCAVLGPCLVLAAGLGRGPWLVAFAVVASLAQCGNELARIAILARSSVPELRACFELLCHDLRLILAARLVCTGLALVLVAVVPLVACLLALAGELLGRYLFFAGVVPKGIASTYLEPKEVAAT
jgi:DMSO reductase anchor subunit